VRVTREQAAAHRQKIVDGYLSSRHRDDPGHGCLLPAVGSDVVRQPRSVRHVFTEGLRAKVETLRQLFAGPLGGRPARKGAGDDGRPRGSAHALSRAVDDEKLSDEILRPGQRFSGGCNATTPERARGGLAPMAASLDTDGSGT
jgi:TetR/AcrR family transcriptional repressor of nem operon